MSKSTSEKQNNQPVSLSVGGIAPNVIRELSGIYPTFVSAFKELVSNAYDADASQVHIRFVPDMSSIVVEDDGIGMTPFEFQKEYLRIGGSAQRQRGEQTAEGRNSIGRKGIGFLAIARYCKQVEINSQTTRTVSLNKHIEIDVIQAESQIGLTDQLAVPFLNESFASRLGSWVTVQTVRDGTIELSPDEYEHQGATIIVPTGTWRRIKELAPSSLPVLNVKYTVDCRAIELRATIDYDYLLNLQDDHNLETVRDFCQVRLNPHSDIARSAGTQIKLYLREFVQQELLSPQRRGRVRNMGSASGLARFLWDLGRSIPVSYRLSVQELEQLGLPALVEPISPTPFSVRVTGPDGQMEEIKRSLWNKSAVPNIPDNLGNSILVKHSVQVAENGLAAQGYLMGFSQPIFPAELRGIAVRVRGVEIGKPDFLGIDHDVPVKYRSLLNQVMGEVIVTEGLDALSAIMPGREGFYAENTQFQTLKNHLVGDGTIDLGALGLVLKQLYERYSIESSVARVVQDAQKRRKAFLDVSMAITSLYTASHYGRTLRRLFTRSDVAANGLRHAPEYPSQLPPTIADYAVEVVEDGLGTELTAAMEPQDDQEPIPYELDIERGVVRFSRRCAIWNTSLYMMGHELTISLRQGQPDDPICEIDLTDDTIYLNWMHPTRAKMGDAMFIKSALYWRIAYLAADNDVDMMMNLAHRLLSV